MTKLEKSQTGIACEYYVAGELSRLGYNVTLTFGYTKSIDLLIEKEGKLFAVQVKGIQATKSICWNVNKTKLGIDSYYVLVNLHVDVPHSKPEFFVLTDKEVEELFKDTPSQGNKRAYLDYKVVKKHHPHLQNRWWIFGNPTEIK